MLIRACKLPHVASARRGGGESRRRHERVALVRRRGQLGRKQKSEWTGRQHLQENEVPLSWRGGYFGQKVGYWG